MFMTAVLYTDQTDLLNFDSFSSITATQITLIVINSLIAISISFLISYTFAFIYDVPKETIRELYQLLKTHNSITLLKEWQKVEKRAWRIFCCSCWTCVYWIKLGIGFLIHFGVFLFCAYISFAFCAVYPSARFAWLCGVIYSVLSDIIIFEILTEVFIAALYSCRGNHKCVLMIAEALNRMRAYKTLT